jgi:heme/copper-type cytochrome/quinol oxidase subunit 2
MKKQSWTLVVFVCGIVVGVAAMVCSESMVDSLGEVKQAIEKAQREKNWPLESTLWAVQGAILSETEAELNAVVIGQYVEPMRQYLKSFEGE